MPTISLCWSPHPTITLSLEDVESQYITARLQFKEHAFFLSVDRRDGGYAIQDLQGSAWEDGARRQGTGTLLMNTALQYLQFLHVRETDRLWMEGELYAAPGQAPSRQCERRAFFNRFGFDIPDESARFRQNLDQLKVVRGGHFMGRYESYVPLLEFRPC